MVLRRKRFWQGLGMGALTLLLLAALLAVGLNAGPDEQAPGPEKYHIVHDDRQGLQTEAVFLNASPAASYVDDPQLGAPYITLNFGNAAMETYDMDGNLMFRSTATEDGIMIVDDQGAVLAESHDSSPYNPIMHAEHPLYSYRWGAAMAPYWLAMLQQS